MNSRTLENVVTGAIGSCLGLILYAAWEVVIMEREDFTLLGAFLVVSFTAAYFLWRQQTLRFRILILSQRPWAHPLLAFIPAALPDAIAIVLLPHVLPQLSVMFRQELPSLLRSAVLVVFLVTWFIFWAILASMDHISVKAAQCHLVLRRIERQQGLGIYRFLDNAPAVEVRRESRILDYLTARQSIRKAHGQTEHTQSPQLVVYRRTFGRYELRTGNILTGTEYADNQATISAAANRNREQTRYEDHTLRIAKYANFMWRDGSKSFKRWRIVRQYWRRAGDPVPEVKDPLYVNPFFGNDMDALFNGGIGFRVAAEASPKFVTLVIKGEPGTGKSTTALQLSVTLAKRGNTAVYYTVEEERETLIQAAYDFGWQRGEKSNDGIEYKGVLAGQFVSIKKRIGELQHRTTTSDSRKKHKGFRGQRKLKQQSDTQAEQSLMGSVLLSSLGHHAMSVQQRMRQLHKEWNEVPDSLPACVVIDSLQGFANAPTEPGQEVGVPRSEMLQIKEFFRDRCEVLVILVEDDGTGTPTDVDFVADVVIRLGRRDLGEESLVFAEILKSRNQRYALGQHQIKIRSQSDLTVESTTTEPGAPRLHHVSGVQVIPSLYFRLYQARHHAIFDRERLNAGLAGVDEMLLADRASGMRRKSTTALLGPGGTGKSLIAMNFLLEGVRENCRTLLIALQDDETTIRTRGIAQEPGRMQFSWEGVGDTTYHRFRWTLEGVAQWWKEHRVTFDDSPLRLPYLFKGEIVPYEGRADLSYREQANAVAVFLRRLAEACPPGASDGNPVKWDDHALEQIRDAYDEAWQEFEASTAQWLLNAWDSGVKQRFSHKKLQLMNGPGSPMMGSPYLEWDSRYWDPDKEDIVNDTKLLDVWYLRPGNITPEDFLNQLILRIGQPTEPSVYARVVFDDVSQMHNRAPVLASSPLFLPALIDIFKATGVTAWFLGGRPDAPDAETLWGLAVMADHVIRTSVKFCSSCESLQAIGATPIAQVEAIKGGIDSITDRGHHTERITVLEIAPGPGSMPIPPYRLRVSPVTANM